MRISGTRFDMTIRQQTTEAILAEFLSVGWFHVCTLHLQRALVASFGTLELMNFALT